MRGRWARAASAVGTVVAVLVGCTPGPSSEPATGPASPTATAAAPGEASVAAPTAAATSGAPPSEAVLAPDADEAITTTFDTRILGGHVGGGVLWVVRRGEDGQANHVHRFRDGEDQGATSLPGGLVADAVGDASGLWVATGSSDVVHLDAATGEVDRTFTVDDAEWIGGGADRIVVAGPPAGASGTQVTVADAATGEVDWSVLAPDPPWTTVVDVAWLDGAAWLAHFELADTPDDVRGGIVTVAEDGDPAPGPDLELRTLDAAGDRLVGLLELLSLRRPDEPSLAVVGPDRDALAGVRLGRPDDVAFLDLAVAGDAVWVPVAIDGDDRPRVVEVRADGSTPRAVRLPVPRDQGLEWVAVEGDDLWFTTSGPEIGPDGDLPTTLWRLPGVAG